MISEELKKSLALIDAAYKEYAENGASDIDIKNCLKALIIILDGEHKKENTYSEKNKDIMDYNLHVMY